MVRFGAIIVISVVIFVSVYLSSDGNTRKSAILAALAATLGFAGQYIVNLSEDTVTNSSNQAGQTYEIAVKKEETPSPTPQPAKKKKYISVPDVTGMRSQEARKNLKKVNLKIDMIQADSTSVAEDYVISQSPVADKKVKRGTVVTIYVSESGPSSEKSEATPAQTPIPTAPPATMPAPTPESTEKILYCCASEYVTLRSIASRSGAALARIYTREAVIYLGTDGEFYYVSYRGQNGYVLKDFFSEDPDAPLNYDKGNAPASTAYYCCASEYATLRSIASRSGTELARIYTRESVQYISSAGEFYYVSYNGQNGYVLKNYFSTDPDAALNYGTN